jgi:hypothetical protein
LIDLAPTILAALGAPSTTSPTGRILHEIVGADATVAAREADDADGAVVVADRPTVTDTEADEMEEHLRGLGYLE